MYYITSSRDARVGRRVDGGSNTVVVYHISTSLVLNKTNKGTVFQKEEKPLGIPLGQLANKRKRRGKSARYGEGCDWVFMEELQSFSISELKFISKKES